MKMPKELAKRAYEHWIRLGQLASEPYATHTPVLIAVASIVRPETILEFGGGVFSTLSFGNHEIYPSVQRVISYENDRGWYLKLREAVPVGSCIDLNYVDGPMHAAVDEIDLSLASMMFIDDSPSGELRSRTVAAVARKCGSGQVIVLHDTDLWRLRWSSRRFEHRVVIDAFNPQSSILWNGHKEWVSVYEHVNHVIHANSGRINLTDATGWKGVFSNVASDLARTAS